MCTEINISLQNACLSQLMFNKIASLVRQEPQPTGTTKLATTYRLGKILRTTSVVRSTQNPQDVLRYKNVHLVEEGGNLHILSIHDASSKPKDQYITDI